MRKVCFIKEIKQFSNAILINFFRALEELSAQLQNTKDSEEGLRVKVDSHWSQISKQINRLKILKVSCGHLVLDGKRLML